MENKIAEKLKLLSLLDKVYIEEFPDGRIKVSCKEYDTDFKQLSAYFEEGEIRYAMEDIYDNSSDVEYIDMDQLKILNDVIEQLLK